MPLHIIRQDITKVECDAIVNAANETLLGGGGVDGAIHKAAGEELLLECQTLGGCKTGEAKITNGYNLPAKYVIHTVGPIWQGGGFGEREKLISCYQRSLELARAHGCQTVAFPLISAGVYGYPKRDAFRIAVNTVSDFLMDNEMTVYIVVFDKGSFILSSKLFDDVIEYIDDNYVGKRENESALRRRRAIQCGKLAPMCNEMGAPICKEMGAPICCEELFKKPSSLEKFIRELDASFSVMLLKLIDAKGMSDVECYKKANVSKQTWYKIMNEKDYKPSRNTVIAFAIALKLNYDETQSLLKTVGFTLSRSSKFDVIIEYFLINEIYDINRINETLFQFDQACLGV